MKVVVQCLEGKAKDLICSFDEHDTLVLGRETDCQIHIPNDPAVSRHHFLMEVNPPHARLRDFGSLNGTFVNGKRVGGRKRDQSPEEGARRLYPEIDLKDGDRIQVGETTLLLTVDRGTLDLQPDSLAGKALRCSSCGREDSSGDAPAINAEFICAECRDGSRSDPMALVGALVRKAERARPQDVALPDYEIGRKIGAGAFGAVYLATHKATGEQVAIKMMLAQVAVSSAARDLFLMREMEVQKGLSHPNIVRLRGHGYEGGAFYFVLDYCNGGDVSRLMKLRGGKVPFKEATSVIREALEGLAHAHSKGFVHRDLKPANLLLSTVGDVTRALITDFGLAKNFQKAGLSGMTVTGTAGGTPDYMPREQLTNFRDAPPASDVFSMAATYYTLLAGIVPRERLPGQDPIRAVLQQPVVEIERREPGVPSKVAAVINRALQPNAKDRYPSATEFKDALDEALKP